MNTRDIIPGSNSTTHTGANMRASIDGKDYVDVAEAAKILDYTAEYTRRLIRRGKLTAVKRGNMWFVDVSSLQEYKHQMDSLGDEKYSPWRD